MKNLIKSKANDYNVCIGDDFPATENYCVPTVVVEVPGVS